MASLLTPAFVAAAGLPADPAGQAEAVAAWHRRKTEIYTAMVAAGTLPARPGIARIIEEAYAAGWPLAVASTSAEPSVRAVLEHVVGAEPGPRLHGAGRRHRAAQEAGAGHLPAGPRPARAGRRTRPSSSRTPATGWPRRSRPGSPASSRSTATPPHEDFTGAAFVVDSLGDPGAEPVTVLANHSPATPGTYVTLADLAAVFGERDTR